MNLPFIDLLEKLLFTYKKAGGADSKILDLFGK